MPKRKREEKYDKLMKKLRKIEKKLQSSRSRSRSSSRHKSDSSYQSDDREHDQNSAHNGAESQQENVGGASLRQMQQRSIESYTVPSEIQVIADADPTTSSTAVESTNSVMVMEPSANTSSSEPIEVEVSALDTAVLEILGDDPSVQTVYGVEIQKDLAIRQEHIATHGLSKELRKELLEKYLVPSNSKLINAPMLNAEIKAALSDANSKRDKSIELKQKQVATAITCLGQAISKQIAKGDSDPDLLKNLMDAGRILCDVQYGDSITRRNFILSSLKKDMKDQLQNTRPEEFLFGRNLSETIKTAKAIINKSGAELKTPLPKPQQYNRKSSQTTAPGTSKNLNWKGPYPPRRPNYLKMTKESHQNKKRPSSSSKQSQHPSSHSRR